mgnify:CR=1 FL=1
MFKRGKSKWFLSVLVVVLFLGFSAGDGFGKITKDYDEYNECTMYNSDIHDVDPWSIIRMYLEKKDNKFRSKTIQLVLKEKDPHYFSKKNLKMEIDGNLLESEFVARESEQVLKNSTLTSALYMLNDETINKIYNAEAITITAYMDNVQVITWDVANKVLNEWKELIAMSGIINNYDSDDGTDASDDEANAKDDDGDTNATDNDGSGGGGGGGCIMNPQGGLNYTWLLLLIIPAFMLRMRKS